MIMAKRKKKKTKSSRLTLRSGKAKKKKSSSAGQSGPWFVYSLKVFAIICVLAVVSVGLLFLEHYVRTTTGAGEKVGGLELVNVPDWASDALIERIHIAAGAKGEDFRLDEDAAMSVSGNLSSMVWLEDVRVQVTADAILVKARWRRPICLIRAGSKKFYLDSNLVVLDWLAVPKLAIVELKGALGGIVPDVGQVWRRDDLAAAVEILKFFERRDEEIAPARPLLYEIASIDVSNFDGRKDWRGSHIVLYVKDGTEIRWGAKLGDSGKHMEAAEDEKLAMLYGHYKKYGTLQGLFKYIELRHPRKKMPQPVDGY